MRRSRLLKLCSILLMLTALVRLVFGIMMINFYSTALTFGAVTRELIRMAGVTAWTLILHALTLLVCGFLGALNWEEPMAARRCAVWGCVCLCLGLLGNGLQAITGYGVSYVAWITGVIAPGLFLRASVRFARRARIILPPDQKPITMKNQQ